MKSIYAYLFSWLNTPTRVGELTVASQTAPQSDRQSKIEIGQYNERLVSNELSKLDPRYYRVLNNITLLSNGNTSVTQIDHIVISMFGIFCIETKGHKGWIIGNRKDSHWTQVCNNNRYSLYSPLRQSYSHEIAIGMLIGKNKLREPIIPLVVFPSASQISVQYTDAVGDLAATMQKLLSHSSPVYLMTEVYAITNTLMSANITDEVILEKHNKEVDHLNATPKIQITEYAH